MSARFQHGFGRTCDGVPIHDDPPPRRHRQDRAPHRSPPARRRRDRPHRRPLGRRRPLRLGRHLHPRRRARGRRPRSTSCRRRCASTTPRSLAAFVDRAQAAGVDHVTFLSARGVETAPPEAPLRAVELDLLTPRPERRDPAPRLVHAGLRRVHLPAARSPPTA